MARSVIPLYIILVFSIWDQVFSQGVCLDERMDLVIIVDSSSTLGEENFELVLGLVETLLDDAAIDSGNVHAGFMTYGTSSVIRFELEEYDKAVDIIDAVYSVEYSGGDSNTADALSAARSKVFNTHADRPDAQNVIILITDGYSDINAHRTAQEAEMTRQNGIQIYVVGIGLRDTSEIDLIASKPLGTYRHTADDFTRPAEIKTKMFPAARCDGELPVTERTNAVQPHVLDSEEQDLVFLLHFSNDMYQVEFQKVLNFMTSLLERADIDSGLVRVGAALYRDQGVVIFDLKAYRSKKEVFEAIEKIPFNFKSNRANLAAGINVVRDQMFADSAGDRPDIPNGVIIITDSNSNIGVESITESSNELKDAGVTVFSIGIGLENPDEIVLVASNQELSYILNDVAQLPALTTRLQDRVPSLSKLVPVVEETIIPENFVPLGFPTPTLQNSESADIVVLFHAGHKVSSREFNKGLEYFISKIFQKAQIDSGEARGALVNYGASASEVFGLSTHKDKKSLRKDVLNMKPKQYRNSNANLGAGLQLVRTKTFTKAEGSRIADGVPGALIVITDMASSSDANLVAQEVINLKNMGITLFTVGIGKADINELESMASQATFHQRANKFQDLVKGDNAVDKIRNEILALQKPQQKPPTSIKTTARATTTPATTTHMATAEIPKKPKYKPLHDSDQADIVVAFHVSSSSSEQDFKRMLSFIKDLFSRADFNGGKARLGVMAYGESPSIQFQLNEHTSWASISNAIDRINSNVRSDVVDTSVAMVETLIMFDLQYARADVPKAVFLITDSASTVNADFLADQKEVLESEGIEIFAIGVGMGDKSELETVSTKPRNVHTVSNYRDLPTLTNILRRDVRSLAVNTDQRLPITFPGASTPVFPVFRTTTVPPLAITFPTPQSGCGLAKVDLVIILDSSTSVGQDNYNKMLQFTKDLLQNSDIDSGSVRVGVVSYSTAVTVHFQLKDYNTRSEVFDAIDKIPYTFGSTNTADALRTMRTDMFTVANGDRSDVKNVAIIITDGVSNINSRRTIPEAVSARDEGIHIYAIGIGLSDVRELNDMSSRPASENTFSVQSFDELKGLDQKIFSSICPVILPSRPARTTAAPTTTTTGTIPTRPPRTTPRTTTTGTVPTRPPRTTPRITTTVSVPPTTTPIPTTTAKPHGYDLVVVMDSSVDRRYFGWFKNFVKTLPDQLDIDGGEYRIGLMRYSTTGDIQWNLDDYANNGAGFKRAVDRVTYRSGETNTDRAIDKVRQQMFRRREGDRDYARNFILLLTANDKSADTNRVWAAAEKAEDDDIYLYTIGLNIRDRTEIDETSSHPLSTYEYLVRSERELNELPGRLRFALKDEPEVAPPMRPRPRLTTTTTTTTTTTRRTTTTAPPRDHGYDIILVLDSSVKPGHFRWMKSFSKALSQQLSVNDGEVRIGLMRYSTYADRQFELNQHTTSDALSRAVDRVQYRPGSTNTARALDAVRTRMFSPSNGDRDYARNYVILLTGQDESLSTNDAWRAAERLENDGVGLYVIGLEIGDRTEVDELASHPLSTYQYLTRSETELLELPGQINFGLKGMSKNPDWPPYRPRPTITTTPRPTTTYRPRPPGKCTSVADIVFVLDSSGSVGRYNFYNVLNFTYNIVDDLDIDNGNYRIGVVSFSDSARQEFYLNTHDNKADIERALTRVNYVYGSTHTAAALRMVREQMLTPSTGDRPGVPNVVVIVTDGESNIQHTQTLPEAMLLKNTGATLITVAVGFTEQSAELVGLTSEPVSENLIRVADYNSLTQLRDKLVEPLCTDDNLCRTNPCKNDAVCVDGLRSYRCVCPDGYYGTNCEKSCSGPADVVFMLDSSTNIGSVTFERMKRYSETLVREMNVEDCGVRVGFMKYSSAPMIQFNMNRYHDTDTITRAVDDIHYTHGQANMADAFREVRTRMFNTADDRRDVRNIVYLLTDGSNDVKTEDTMMEAEITINEGINIIPIGIQLRHRYEIENIALSQGVRVEEINDDNDLKAMSDQMLRPVMSFTDFCDGSPCEHGGTCHSDALGYRCDCVPGYTGDNCNKRCQAKADIVFAVDTSRYVSRKDLRQVKKFVKSLVKRMSFKNKMKAGIVQFGEKADVKLTFKESYKKRNVLTAVSSIRRSPGDPNPAEAFRKARISILDAGGDREYVPNYVVLITHSMRQENEVIDEANQLKQKRTKVIGVGIGLSSSDEEFMMAAVSAPVRSYMYTAKDVNGLTDISDNIMAFLCNERDHCESAPCRNGGQCMSEHNGYYCECRAGFAGQNCDRVCDAKADVAFLLDSSGSIGQHNFRLVKDYVYKVVEEMTIGKRHTRVGVVSYSTTARMGFYLDDYISKSGVQDAISSISYEYGNTNTAAGIKMVRRSIFNPSRGDRADAQNFLIIITDGISNVNAPSTIPEAEQAKEEGVHVITIGVGSFDTTELRAMASEPVDKNSFVINDFNALSGLATDLVNATCRDPSVCDASPCKNGGLCSVGINSYVCECPKGYTGPTCEKECMDRKDVVFVLDSSASVGKDNFRYMLDFAAALVEEVGGMSNEHRFSLITYSTEVNLIFSLGRYWNTDQTTKAILSTRYTPGSTNTAGGLRTAKDVFSNGYGGRYSAEDVVILLTDGESNVNSEDTIPAAEALKKDGVKIISVGIGLTDLDEVQAIASSDRDVFQAKDFRALKDIRTDISTNSCRRNGS